MSWSETEAGVTFFTKFPEHWGSGAATMIPSPNRHNDPVEAKLERNFFNDTEIEKSKRNFLQQNRLSKGFLCLPTQDTW